ncbi:MAG: DUF3307 domain-containing protein [Lachnospiraceae bacterium]|nr:DUF3307 domain-containing protein [Lachnospiraceae bacterium]
MLLFHFLADFVLQTSEQAQRKSESFKFLLYHVLTYTSVWMIAFFVLPLKPEFNNMHYWFIFGLLIAAPHFVMDLLTSRIKIVK